MKEYVNNVCNYFNNLKGYMEFDELVELLHILSYGINCNVETYQIRKYLGEGYVNTLNDYIECDMEDEFYNDLVKFLEKIEEIDYE